MYEQWLIRKHNSKNMTPFIAEFLGTMILILIGEGVVANMLLAKTKGHGGGIISITTAWALGVFIAVVIAGPYSGAHLNPAITLGFALAGKFAWAGVLPYILAQLLGAAMGALLVWIFYYDHFKVTDDQPAKLAIFCTGPSIRNYPINLFCEVVGTFVLMFVVFYITGGEVQLLPTDSTMPIGLGSVGAIPVAFTVWAIGLALGGVTGYAINPARDFAPRCMHALLPIHGKGGSDWSYSWIPIVGPLLGASIAAGLYLILQ